MLWLLLLLLMLLIPFLAGALLWWETRTHAAPGLVADAPQQEGAAAEGPA
jgi:uncharacterized iron-regulated membrane protein